MGTTNDNQRNVFSIGDRVLVDRGCLPSSFSSENTLGTICWTGGGELYGVRLDEENGDLHDCEGLCDDNHGYYVFECHIRVPLFDENGDAPELAPLSDEAFCGLLGI